jgi:imidazole glycerol-phosphate synthase subunit HisH
MIVIVDYGMGNLRSVYNKLKWIGHTAEISSDPKVIARADKIILPGVGHFRTGMDKLREYGLIDILNHKVLTEKVPIFGICLGVQLFTKRSEEGNAEGLGWIDAETIRFYISEKQKYRIKVPHVGWNSVSLSNKKSLLFKGVDENELFYFVHSYYLRCNDYSVVLGTSNYLYEFVSCIEKDNIFGTQFHPEKSQDVGIKLFENFVNL